MTEMRVGDYVEVRGRLISIKDNIVAIDWDIYYIVRHASETTHRDPPPTEIVAEVVQDAAVEDTKPTL